MHGPFTEFATLLLIDTSAIGFKGFVATSMPDEGWLDRP